MGFGVIGAGRYNFNFSNMASSVRADGILFGFLFLTSTLVFQLGFSSGRTIFKSPNNAKPCSLPAMP
jgi:hypothetical protein